jgi:hypothetical protein
VSEIQKRWAEQPCLAALGEQRRSGIGRYGTAHSKLASRAALLCDLKPISQSRFTRVPAWAALRSPLVEQGGEREGLGRLTSDAEWSLGFTRDRAIGSWLTGELLAGLG